MGWLLCLFGVHKLKVQMLFASGVNDFWPFEDCERGCGHSRALTDEEARKVQPGLHSV